MYCEWLSIEPHSKQRRVGDVLVQIGQAQVGGHGDGLSRVAEETRHQLHAGLCCCSGTGRVELEGEVEAGVEVEVEVEGGDGGRGRGRGGGKGRGRG